MFHVVCIDDRPLISGMNVIPTGLTVGTVYTVQRELDIQSIFDGEIGLCHVYVLEEVTNPLEGCGGFHARRFRRIAEEALSQFRSFLTKTPTEEEVA
jgi:hypothetical protein